MFTTYFKILKIANSILKSPFLFENHEKSQAGNDLLTSSKNTTCSMVVLHKWSIGGISLVKQQGGEKVTTPVKSC